MTLKGFKTLPKTEQEIVEQYMKDVQESKEQAQLKSQDQEFRAYLERKVANTPEKYVGFFRDMLKYMNDGVILTDGMVNALRKCIQRDIQRDQEFEAKRNNLQSAQRPITLKIKPWLMKDMGIDSRIISGVVKAESAKAYLIEGNADMLVNACWCMRCGRELTEPASQVTGFGEWCASKIGIPYRTDILLASAKVRKEIRMQFVRKLHDQKFERWIPKSQVEEIVTEETEKLEVMKAPKRTQSEARTKVKAKRTATTAKKATKAAPKKTTAKKPAAKKSPAKK